MSIPTPLTEADVRRVVREELRAAVDAEWISTVYATGPSRGCTCPPVARDKAMCDHCRSMLPGPVE